MVLNQSKMALRITFLEPDGNWKHGPAEEKGKAHTLEHLIVIMHLTQI